MLAVFQKTLILSQGLMYPRKFLHSGEWPATSDSPAFASQGLISQMRATTPSLYGAENKARGFTHGRQVPYQLYYIPSPSVSLSRRVC